ncbi:hypothetical protein [Alicyclobacillus dauci]|uniref:Uncharacterized protein n=1 Tax=Alicyclobacillus dauci TaxID=1475485 RepID=A0ABY6YY57_9BACL|nr:hypothetical protein [Alicyclobacillus dauci]WAH35218.1 hypothetical protein NZD86_12935 [Alicyclobacillus dauci]
MKRKVCALVLTCSVLLSLAGCGNAVNNTAGGFAGGIGNGIGQGANAIGNATGLGNGDTRTNTTVRTTGSTVGQHTVQVDSANRTIYLRFANTGTATNTTAAMTSHVSHLTVPTGWVVRIQGPANNNVAVTVNQHAGAGPADNTQGGRGRTAANGGVNQGRFANATLGGTMLPGSTDIGGIGTAGRGAAGGTAAGAGAGTIAGRDTGIDANATGPANNIAAMTDHVFRATRAGQYAVVLNDGNRSSQVSTITVSTSARLPSFTS